MPDRRLGYPTREQLSAASIWVWILLAIAVANLVVLITQGGTISLGSLTYVFASSLPAVLAAALVHVAPRENLVRLAAVGFAVPVVVSAIAAAVRNGVFTSDVISSDYALLVPRLTEWTDALSPLSSVFTFVAIVCLAVYIGPLRTRAGWLIVGISIAIAGAQILLTLVQWQSVYDEQFDAPVYPLELLIPSMLSRLVVVAWGYLLAVTFERRFALLATASAGALIGALLNLVTFTATLLAGPSQANAAIFAITPFGWIVQLFWLVAVAGVLLELPRHGRQQADRDQTSDSKTSREAFSPGQ